MNQLEAPVHATAAESAKTSGVLAGPLPPCSVLTKEAKHDHPELDQEDGEQAQQEQDNQQCGHYSGYQRGLNGSSDDACEPMVNYDGFESLGRPFSTAGLTHFVLGNDDGDDDVVNVRSPIICKPTSSSDACSRSATLSPTCVSALGRDEGSDEPSWTIQEFQEYLGMLEMLEEVCSNSEMCLSADNLSQMERLLTSLLPQGV